MAETQNRDSGKIMENQNVNKYKSWLVSGGIIVAVIVIKGQALEAFQVEAVTNPLLSYCLNSFVAHNGEKTRQAITQKLWVRFPYGPPINFKGPLV